MTTKTEALDRAREILEGTRLHLERLEDLQRLAERARVQQEALLRLPEAVWKNAEQVENLRKEAEQQRARFMEAAAEMRARHMEAANDPRLTEAFAKQAEMFRQFMEDLRQALSAFSPGIQRELPRDVLPEEGVHERPPGSGPEAATG